MQKKTLTDNLRLIAGYLLTTAGVIYITLAIYKNWQNIQPLLQTSEIWLWVLYGTISWALGMAILAMTWAKNVINLSAPEAPKRQWRNLSVLYGQSNIAKYIPGNIFHMVARQMKASTLGYRHEAIATATMLESAALLMAAILTGASALIIGGHGLALLHYMKQLDSGIDTATLYIILFVAIAVTIGVFFHKNLPFRKLIANTVLTCFSSSIFFVLLGISVALISSVFLPLEKTIPIAATYILSWAIGYILPGASAGIGVRESTFIIILASLNTQLETEEDILLLVAFATRLVNTAGDFLIYSCATLLGKTKQAEHAE